MKQTHLTRRAALRTGTAAAAVLAAPPFLRLATAATPIKIGIPTVITGGYAILGQQTMRTCKLVEKTIGRNVLSRPVAFEYRDTQGNPADCVRKCQELVERDGITLTAGVIMDSHTAAVQPKPTDTQD
jgi:ABC-type branched-subunit amino acid transport system substrate-binding protein